MIEPPRKSIIEESDDTELVDFDENSDYSDEYSGESEYEEKDYDDLFELITKLKKNDKKYSTLVELLEYIREENDKEQIICFISMYLVELLKIVKYRLIVVEILGELVGKSIEKSEMANLLKVLLSDRVLFLLTDTFYITKDMRIINLIIKLIESCQMREMTRVLNCLLKYQLFSMCAAIPCQESAVLFEKVFQLTENVVKLVDACDIKEIMGNIVGDCYLYDDNEENKNFSRENLDGETLGNYDKNNFELTGELNLSQRSLNQNLSMKLNQQELYKQVEQSENSFEDTFSLKLEQKGDVFAQENSFELSQKNTLELNHHTISQSLDGKTLESKTGDSQPASTAEKETQSLHLEPSGFTEDIKKADENDKLLSQSLKFSPSLEVLKDEQKDEQKNEQKLFSQSLQFSPTQVENHRIGTFKPQSSDKNSTDKIFSESLKFTKTQTDETFHLSDSNLKDTNESGQGIETNLRDSSLKGSIVNVSSLSNENTQQENSQKSENIQRKEFPENIKKNENLKKLKEFTVPYAYETKRPLFDSRFTVNERQARFSYRKAQNLQIIQQNSSSKSLFSSNLLNSYFSNPLTTNLPLSHCMTIISCVFTTNYTSFITFYPLFSLNSVLRLNTRLQSDFLTREMSIYLRNVSPGIFSWLTRFTEDRKAAQTKRKKRKSYNLSPLVPIFHILQTLPKEQLAQTSFLNLIRTEYPLNGHSVYVNCPVVLERSTAWSELIVHYLSVECEHFTSNFCSSRCEQKSEKKSEKEKKNFKENTSVSQNESKSGKYNNENIENTKNIENKTNCTCKCFRTCEKFASLYVLSHLTVPFKLSNLIVFQKVYRNLMSNHVAQTENHLNEPNGNEKCDLSSENENLDQQLRRNAYKAGTRELRRVLLWLRKWQEECVTTLKGDYRNWARMLFGVEEFQFKRYNSQAVKQFTDIKEIEQEDRENWAKFNENFFIAENDENENNRSKKTRLIIDSESDDFVIGSDAFKTQ